jgi:light-regulated signal transduction histidine kinase (bacteriophytochrome)
MIIDIDKIIEDLKRKGLIITDLEEFSYYIEHYNVNTFITQYSDFFENEHHGFNNVNASEIIKLYIFDKNFANHIFRDILNLEKIMNTVVAVSTINYFDIKDKCILNIDENILKNSILRNIKDIQPYIEYKSFLYKMTKYLDTNKASKKLIAKDEHDDIMK